MTLARAVMFNPNTRKEKAQRSPKSSRRYASSPDPEPTPTPRSTYGNIPLMNYT